MVGEAVAAYPRVQKAEFKLRSVRFQLYATRFSSRRKRMLPVCGSFKKIRGLNSSEMDYSIRFKQAFLPRFEISRWVNTAAVCRQSFATYMFQLHLIENSCALASVPNKPMSELLPGLVMRAIYYFCYIYYTVILLFKVFFHPLSSPGDNKKSTVLAKG